MAHQNPDDGDSPAGIVIFEGSSQYHLFGDISEQQLRQVLTDIFGPMALGLDSGDDDASINTVWPTNGDLPNVINHVVIEFSQGTGHANHVHIEVDVFSSLSERDLEQIFSAIREFLLPPRNDREQGTTSSTESAFVVRWHNAVERGRTFFRKAWKRLRSIRINCVIVYE